MPFFRNKYIIEAVQLTKANKQILTNFIPGSVNIQMYGGKLIADVLLAGTIKYTLTENDWLIKDSKGNFFAVSAQKFEAYYEPAPEPLS